MDEELKSKLAIRFWMQIVPTIMLFLCLIEWPYFYYVVLRVLVCVSAIAHACSVATFVEDIENKALSYILWGLVGIFGLIAILFNPLLPFHLSREVWVPIDLTTAVLFMICLFVLRLPRWDSD